jgi:predicted ribosome-associated RNA-binding protein Tma20
MGMRVWLWLVLIWRRTMRRLKMNYLAPEGDPLWLTIGKGSDELIPTIYALWKKRELLPFISTPPSVIPVLVGGADLMIPGGQRFKK